MEEDRYISVSRCCQLHYRIDKHATTQAAVVLLHGLSSNLTRWTEFLQHTSLKQNWTTLRIDLRGHGESRYRGKLTTSIMANDLRKVVEAENIQQLVIVGHSLGARIAAEYAVQYPETCLGTILIDPVVPEALQGKGLTLYRASWLMKAIVIIIRGMNAIGFRRKKIPMRDLFELDEKTRVLLANQSHESIAQQYMSPRIDLEFNPLVIYLQDLIETLSIFPETVKSQIPTHVLLSSGGSISDVVLLEKYFSRGINISIEHLEADHWPLTEKPTQTREVIEKAVSAIQKKRNR